MQTFANPGWHSQLPNTSKDPLKWYVIVSGELLSTWKLVYLPLRDFGLENLIGAACLTKSANSMVVSGQI